MSARKSDRVVVSLFAFFVFVGVIGANYAVHRRRMQLLDRDIAFYEAQRDAVLETITHPTVVGSLFNGSYSIDPECLCSEPLESGGDYAALNVDDPGALRIMPGEEVTVVGGGGLRTCAAVHTTGEQGIVSMLRPSAPNSRSSGALPIVDGVDDLCTRATPASLEPYNLDDYVDHGHRLAITGDRKVIVCPVSLLRMRIGAAP